MLRFAQHDNSALICKEGFSLDKPCQILFLFLPQLAIRREDDRFVKRLLGMPIDENFPFEREAKLIWHLIPDNGVFFDIGANRGDYSVLLKSRVGLKNIYAFEPLPKLQTILIQRLGRRQIFPVALSSEEKNQEIWIPLIEGREFDT